MRNNVCVFCGLKRQKNFKKYCGGIACYECFARHIEQRDAARIPRGRMNWPKTRKTLLSKVINS